MKDSKLNWLKIKYIATLAMEKPGSGGASDKIKAKS